MPITQALQSLEGLATGDAFGAAHGEHKLVPISLELPPPMWRWTDDAHMAMSIVEILSEYGQIDQDALAERFGQRFLIEPNRGYSSETAHLLSEIARGGDWRELVFMNHSDGSFGNGAAMRAAPIGAYFAGDLEKAASEADLSAGVTHAHPEGRAGAIAVTIAAAIVASETSLESGAFIEAVADHTPDSDVKERLLSSKRFAADEVEKAASVLGVGWEISALDTVPFCVWMASHYRGRYEVALWLTAAPSGDRDTTCAIVGGIIASGDHEIPAEWLKRRQDLPVTITPE